MEVSRLTFTKETKEKMSKPLNHFQRGELRWKKIKECEANGTLSKARNRMDIVSMLGGARTYGAVYTWVSNMVSRGHIRETLTGLGKDGKMEYEYSVVKAPSFNPADWSKAKKERAEAKKVGSEVATVAPTTKPVVLNRATVGDSRAKVVIKYNDLTIELENIDQATIEGIVEKLALATKQ